MRLSIASTLTIRKKVPRPGFDSDGHPHSNQLQRKREIVRFIHAKNLPARYSPAMATGALYTATARREGNIWQISIDGVGTTQAEDRDEISQIAIDYLARVTGHAVGQFGPGILVESPNGPRWKLTASGRNVHITDSEQIHLSKLFENEHIEVTFAVGDGTELRLRRGEFSLERD